MFEGIFLNTYFGYKFVFVVNESPTFWIEIILKEYILFQWIFFSYVG